MNAPLSTLVLLTKRGPAELKSQERLMSSHKQRGLTQRALGNLASGHLSQIRRHERGQSKLTLDLIRKIAVALRVSADMLLAQKGENGPDDDLWLKFEAAIRLDLDEETVIRPVMESISPRSTMKATKRRVSMSDSEGRSR